MKKTVLFISVLFILVTTTLKSASIFYLKAGGTVTSTASWGTNINGTGIAPTNFTTANQTFNIRNNASVTLSAAWVVSGANSGVTIGDGITACDFIIPTIAASKLTGSILNVFANATLTLNNNTLPTLTACVFDVASTCVYNNSANTTITTPLANTYGNLTVSGTGATYTMGGSLIITGTLLVSTANTLSLNNTATTNTFTVFNYSQSAGTLDGGSVNTSNATNFSSYINITNSFSKTAGTITNSSPADYTCFLFNGGSAETFSTAGTDNYIFVHIANNTTLTLNSAMSLNGTSASAHTTFTVDAGCTVTAGINLITCNSTTPTCLINGKIQTASPAGFNGTAATCIKNTNAPTIILGAASTIEYNAAGSQTITGRTDYANLTITNNSTKTLAGACTVAAVYTQTNGVVNLNGQTLTLNGTQIFPTSAANGSFTGSATSNLIISGTGITNNLFFTAGSQTLKNLTLSSSAAQKLVLGTDLTVSGVFTHTSAIFNLNGNTLALNGAITFPTMVTNGSFTGSSTSVLNIGGAGTIANTMLMTQTSSSTRSIQDITFNRTGQTLSLGNALDLIGTLTPTLGTFASAGNLTLIASSPTVTARIAPIGGSVTGNVTTQSYAAGGKTGWVLMGAAGITGRTFADWNDNFAITCSGCPNGYYVGGTPFTSIYSYAETVGGLFDNSARYIPIPSTSGAITIGKGYWVYLGNATTNSGDIIYDVTGPVNQGNFTYNLTVTNSGGGTNATDHGYNLLSNPYPSPISWTSLRNGNANVTNAIYVYNPDLSGYASFVAGVSSPAIGSGGMGDLIPSGQGFYIQASAATTLVAKETYKAASSQQLLKTASTPMVFRLNANGNGMQNETAIYFDASVEMYYSTEHDAISLGMDAGYLNIVSSLNDTDYAINGLPTLNQNYSIPFKATTATTDNYQISATDLQNLPSGACLMLHDIYMNADWDLRTGPYYCVLTDTETVARFVLNITIDPNLSVNSNFKNPSCATTSNGYLIAKGSGNANYNYYWKDANNNLIKTSLNKSTADTLQNLQAGNYSVDVNMVGSCSNGTKTFNLQAASYSSSFIPSATNIILVNNAALVTFTNTSNNASSFEWNFGDGQISYTANTTHQYTTAGNYLVSLTAYNQVCADSAVYSQVITVDSTSASTTGIKSFTTENNIFINRDASGYFVQFNYQTKIDAVISVQNLLGEKVVNDVSQENISNNKKYIYLGNTENNVLIISVITSAGEKIFRKIVNY